MASAKVIWQHAKPTLFVDGKPTAPVLYALSDFPGAVARSAYAQRNIAAFAEVGVRLVAADTGLHLGWHKAEGFDPDALISELSDVLDANPDARILLRLHMNPPYWWLRDHPEECILYRTEKGDALGIDNGESDRLIRDDGSGHIRVSLASLKWLAEATEKMEAFLHALESTPEGDALMAVQVACGLYGEWAQWGWDVSEPAQARFRRYLRETYGTEDALRTAWHDADVTFENARFRPEPWLPGDEGNWRDPEKSQAILDALAVQQLAAPEAIRYFCRAAKRAKPSLLCGSFYGYFLGSGTYMPNSLFPEILFEEPAVDFLSAPFCYFPESRRAEGATIQKALLESQRLHGMLWLTEMDQHPAGLEYCPDGDPERLDEARATLRRCALQPLLAGEGFWYYDHRIVPILAAQAKGPVNTSAVSIYKKRGWWERECFMREIGEIQKLAQRIAESPYRSAADVLLVYDTRSCFYQAGGVVETVKLHLGLTRSGVVFDSVYLDDLPRCEMERYQCVIFVNCHVLPPEKRAAYRCLTKGRLAIHLSGQGYCDGKTLSLEHLSRTVGMKMEKAADSDSLFLKDEIVSLSGALRPLFQVTDSDAQALARYANGEVAAAIRENDVYIPLQYLPASLIGPLMRRAKVHIWCESGEPVLAGAGLAAVNCQRPGNRVLTLPGGRRITVQSDGFETPIYRIDTGERVM